MNYISSRPNCTLIETTVFTKQISSLLKDEEYRLLQLYLSVWPTAGDVLKHSGGLRKIRWSTNHKGKRGGLRIIYYTQRPFSTIYFILAYNKSEQEDLTPSQLKTLSEMVKSELK